jgi:hypothetical protein
MPETETLPPRPQTRAETKDITPPAPFATWCDWAQNGLQKALDGISATSTGVESYAIGKRKVGFRKAADQQAVVDQWMKLVELYCGVDALPTVVTGRETAMRVVPRDV